MKKSDILPFLLLLVSLSVGCSGSGSDTGQGSHALPSAPPPAGESPTGSGPRDQSGAIVVYAAHSENASAVNAVSADGQQRTAIAGNATYMAATEDGWVITVQGVQGEDLVSVRVADGTSRILDNTPGSKHPRAVFDTNYVVYEVHGAQSSLHLVRADGSDHLVPAPAKPQMLEFIAVTPSRRILYETCDLIIDDGVSCTDRRLLSVELDGSDERLVLPGAPLIRHITADDLLIYDRSTDTGTALSVVKSDGTGHRTLAEGDTFFVGTLPNGRIVYNRKLYGQLDLYSVATDGTSPRALATSAEDEFYDHAVPGGRVLFVRGTPQQRRLYSVDEATGDIRVLQEAGSSHVRAVAPDGTVIFSSSFGAPGEEEGNLDSVRADGSELRALADSSDMEWFEALAPDGRVVYRRCIPAPSGPCGHATAQSDLYSVNQNATGTVELAASGAFEVARAVTKNNRVVYESIEANRSDVYSVPTTGGRAEPLANTDDDERFLTIIEAGIIGERPGANADAH